MKKILVLLFSFLGLIGCVSESAVTPEIIPDDGSITFSIALPEAEIITKGKDDLAGTNLNSLYLLVFDENGLFLSRYKATRTGTSFTVELINSTRPRIIHFVANYDWSGFSDVANIYKDEKELIPSLVIKDEVAYWKRIFLNSGISQATFPNSVELIRNIAKISTQNLTDLGALKPKLVNMQFAIANQLEYGTIAPFINEQFTEGAVTEAAGSAFLPLTAFSNSAQFLYERKNSTATQPLFLMIKADYVPINNGAVSTCYYKVDLINTGDLALTDIVRNCHYLVKINEVQQIGYATLQEAMLSPASNNINSSIVLQPLLTVSNGTAVLGVETTSLVLTKPNQTFNIQFAYFPNGTSLAYDNTGASVILMNDDINNPVIPSTPGLSVSYSPGKITGTTGAMPSALLSKGKIIVSKLGLTRTILVQFRYPYTMEMPFFSPNPVAQASNLAVSLSFDIPSIVPDNAFPMKFYVTAPNLTPNNTLNTLPVIIEGGKYKYEYTATQRGTQVLYFKTNLSNSTGSVVISNSLFTDAIVNLTSSATNVKTFISWFSIKPSLMPSGYQIVLNLKLPSGSSPVDVNINTTSLIIDPNNATTGEMVNVTPITGGYKYHATSSGSLVQLYFKTTQSNASEAITLSATGFTTSQNLNL